MRILCFRPIYRLVLAILAVVTVLCEPFSRSAACRDTAASSGRSCNRDQVLHAHQVVGCGGEGEDPS